VCFSSAMRETHAIARAIAISLPLVLAGCGIPKLRAPEAGPALPPDFAGKTSPENSAQLGIEEFFGDPVLTKMIAQGLDCNQELKILNQEVQVANNEVLARRGAYLPFVTLGTRAGLDKNSRFTPIGAAEEELEYLPGKHFPQAPGDFAVTGNLFWQIDLWRELRNARDAAAQRYRSAVERRNYFATRLVAEIAENYYELAALDKRLEILNQTISIQEQSLKVAEANKEAARGTELGVQRFLAEVRKNESERLIVRQRIIEVENRVNFLVGSYPQPVDRQSWDFINLDSRVLSVGVPSQLLLNRRDIREAEREVAASGLDVMVARARFFPRLDITAGVGFEAFSPRYLFDPGAFVANAAGDLIVPLINRKAIQADYQSANARQLQAVYNYQRTVLNAFTEVVNRVSKVENYRRSVEIKQQQLASLEASVQVASNLFQSARVEYVEVLLAQRDLQEARTVLVETKQQQLSAIVNAYQALGGGCLWSSSGSGTALPGDLSPEMLPDDPGLPPAPGKASVPPTPPEMTPPQAPDGAAPPAPPAEQKVEPDAAGLPAAATEPKGAVQL